MGDADSAARIFIGNLNPAVDEGELRNRFGAYGPIRACNVIGNKLFGFVQFHEASHAQAAITAENGSEFMGQIINVKPATKRKNENNDGNARQQQPQPHKKQQQQRQRQNQQQHQQQHQHQQQQHQQKRMLESDSSDMAVRKRGGGNNQGHNFNSFGGSGGMFNSQQQNSRGISNFGNLSATTITKKAIVCDCEIVCVNKNQRIYAESVESRLKNLGMNIDVLFPNPEIPLGKILGNITSRGVAYAILITPMHEEHESITVNILQGQPQEHRNMPVDDAVTLLAKHFEINVKSKREVDDEECLPKDVTTVLGFLAENRPLSVMEYDKLIRFLSRRRESMLRSEYGDNIPSHLLMPHLGGPPADPATKAKEEEIKTKILGILNRPKETPAAMAPPPPPPPPATINPSLQRAIDSLIKTGPNLLNQQQHHQGYGTSGRGMMMFGSGPTAGPSNPYQQQYSGYGGGY